MFPSFNFGVSYFFFERTGPHEEPLNSLRGPAIALHQLARDIAEDYVYAQIIHINQTQDITTALAAQLIALDLKCSFVWCPKIPLV